jgi:hypothetical protein
VRQLRYENLRLDEKPHGKIAWPSDTDKTGKAWVVPISAEVRKLLGFAFDSPPKNSAPGWSEVDTETSTP